MSSTGANGPKYEGSFSAGSVHGNCEDRSLRVIAAISDQLVSYFSNHESAQGRSKMTTVVSYYPVDTLEAFHARELEWLQAMAHGGSELAPAAALLYCTKHKIAAPAWVMERASAGYCSALANNSPKKRGRSAGAIERYRQDLRDYARWEMLVTIREKQKEWAEEAALIRSRKGLPKQVLKEKEKQLARVGRTWDDAYECASKELHNTPAFGGPDAMKKSYRQVKQNNRKKSQPLRYHVFDLDFLHAIGIEHPTLWGRVRKSRHFMT
jgi:hypothetical protein